MEMMTIVAHEGELKCPKFYTTGTNAWSVTTPHPVTCICGGTDRMVKCLTCNGVGRYRVGTYSGLVYNPNCLNCAGYGCIPLPHIRMIVEVRQIAAQHEAEQEQIRVGVRRAAEKRSRDRALLKKGKVR